MPRRKKLKGDQLALVMDEVKQGDRVGDRGIVTLVCEPSKLDRLLEFARQHLGDRLVGSAVLVDLTIADATDADLALFRGISAPVEMVADWELEGHSDANG